MFLCSNVFQLSCISKFFNQVFALAPYPDPERKGKKASLQLLHLFTFLVVLLVPRPVR